MEFLAVILGLILGGVVGASISDRVLLLYYHGRYRSEEQFLKLYDTMSERFHFEMFSAMLDKPPKDYASFKRLHSQCRSSAYEKYKSQARNAIGIVFLHIILGTLPINYWLKEDSWIYTIAFLIAFAGSIVYKQLIKKYGVEFYGLLIVATVMHDS